MPKGLRHFRIFAYSAIILWLAASIVNEFLFPNVPAMTLGAFGIQAFLAMLQVGWVWVIVNKKINLVRWAWIAIIGFGALWCLTSLRSSQLPFFAPLLKLSFLSYFGSALVLGQTPIKAWYRGTAESETST